MDNISSHGNQAFIILIIGVTFLLDCCPFLLEVIGANKSSLHLFQAHFEVGMGTPSPRCVDLHFPFHEFVQKGIYWFHKSISYKLHDHSFFSIISNIAIDLHHTHSRSYVDLRVGAWFFVQLVIPFLCLASNVLSFALCTQLGLHYPLILDLSQYINGQHLDPMGTHLHCFHDGERITLHDVVWDAFTSITRDIGFSCFM